MIKICVFFSVKMPKRHERGDRKHIINLMRPKGYRRGIWSHGTNSTVSFCATPYRERHRTVVDEGYAPYSHHLIPIGGSAHILNSVWCRTLTVQCRAIGQRVVAASAVTFLT